MKRTNAITDKKDQIIDVTEKKIWWKNSAGSFHAIIDGRHKIIKPGERFQAYEREIPKAFRNTIYSETPLPAKEPVKVAQATFKAVPSETDNALFDVVNVDTGKVINGHPLEKDEADLMARDLNTK